VEVVGFDGAGSGSFGSPSVLLSLPFLLSANMKEYTRAALAATIMMMIMIAKQHTNRWQPTFRSLAEVLIDVECVEAGDELATLEFSSNSLPLSSEAWFDEELVPEPSNSLDTLISVWSSRFFRVNNNFSSSTGFR